MSNSAKILIIIVTWNKKDFVLDLLASLANLTYPQELLDVVLVDNASSDGTVQAVQDAFPAVRLLLNKENLGGTGGFNTGLSYAFSQPDGAYDFLWLLDNDVVVHKDALSELVTVLSSDPEVSVAGSTMMQLTYPWRINEMGAFVDRKMGRLLLNRHLENVDSLKGKSISALLDQPLDLSRELEHCQPWTDVEYVAAASLLIRADVAKKAGLWEDFFIHFDDVEWCLRIGRMGHRVTVSARSVIWHLPAVNKVPTWILYYDNRNVLYMLEKHGDYRAVKRAKQWVRKRAVYYTLQGKLDLAQLMLEAVADYDKRVQGKKDIALSDSYLEHGELKTVLWDNSVKKVLLPWTVNLQAAGLQEVFVEVMHDRADLQVDFMLPRCPVNKEPATQVPGVGVISFPRNIVSRLFSYFSKRNSYDLVVQSDYLPLLPLNLLGRRILYINDENASLREKASLKLILQRTLEFLFHF